MKIDINKLNIIPKQISNKFGLCVYKKNGEIDNIINEWISYHNLYTQDSDNYINIFIDDKLISDLFIEANTYKYMDGFSPNLNKFLHIGHMSNLVLAKSLKSIGVSEETVSIYGDTLQGSVTKQEAVNKLKEYQTSFDYTPNIEYMASTMKYNGDKLIDGVGEYDGTKIFEYGDEKNVGIKSNGSTSYLYQDMALAESLNDSTLYLTGQEQNNHFNFLKNFFPHINHIGLGLVKVDGKKMSSSVGNVIYLEDFINELMIKFNDIKLVYNVIAGFILKNNPESDKNIDLKSIDNPKNSPGLYLSYTMARLLSAGCEINHIDNFKSKHLEFAQHKAKVNIKPSSLFNELVEHCKEINVLYGEYTIKDNPSNKAMFDEKLADLSLGLKLLGLFNIDKV